MCNRFSLEIKAQEAPGFPPGYRFAFCANENEDEDDDSARHPALQILPPEGNEALSFYDALEDCYDSDAAAKHAAKASFFRHVGKPLTLGDHFLVGKEYLNEWVDSNYSKKVLFGKVTSCKRDEFSLHNTQFLVTYNAQSVKLALSVESPCGSRLRSVDQMSLVWALGGCKSFEDKMQVDQGLPKGSNCPDYWSWVVPDRIDHKKLRLPDGSILPEISLVVKGFQVSLTVRTSSVRNAGKGVFVSCLPLRTREDGLQQSLRLKSGEIVDLGIYAPLRPADRKHSDVHVIKNYIHLLKCEEWAFETSEPDYEFDITDDRTGELHSLARESLLSYVNERQDVANIQAEHDPDGNVHYLLGCRSREFELVADGSETEVFVNYGPSYEQVRVRKGYSFLSDDDDDDDDKNQACREPEALLNILALNESRVDLVVSFLHSVFAPSPQWCGGSHRMPQESVHRALGVAVLLHYRVLSRCLKLMPQSPHVDDPMLDKTERLWKAILQHCHRSFGQERRRPVFGRDLAQRVLTPLLSGFPEALSELLKAIERC